MRTETTPGMNSQARPTDRRRRLSRVAAAALLSLLATGCYGTRKVTDPLLNITTDTGVELGVSTEYGVVFLGQTSERGEVLVEAFFGDGPSIERSVIEPVGAGLYTAEIDIRLPEVPISFEYPEAGETLEIMGRKGWRRWETLTKARVDPRVEGLLLEIPDGFADDPDQVGAGVFRKKSRFERELVGLVSGKIQLERDGSVRRYLAVVGARDLWRLAAHRRDRMRKKPFVYREDIL